MEDWQQRVLDELKELEARHGELADFVDGVFAGEVERPDTFHLLTRQLSAMGAYLDVLEQRAARFTGDHPE